MSLLHKHWTYGVEYYDFLHDVTFTKNTADFVSGGGQSINIDTITPYKQRILYQTPTYEHGVIYLYNNHINYVVEKVMTIHTLPWYDKLVHNYRIRFSESPFPSGPFQESLFSILNKYVEDYHADRRIFYADVNNEMTSVARRNSQKFGETLNETERDRCISFRHNNTYYPMSDESIRVYKYPTKYNEI
jgi:hypothetical protein